VAREADHVANGVLCHHVAVVVVANLVLVLDDRDLLGLNNECVGAAPVDGVDGDEP